MTVIARGQVSGPLNPVLSTFLVAPDTGLLALPEAVSYAIYERVNEDYPRQVWPEPEGARLPCDLQGAPVGDHLSIGRYVARWSVPLDADIGRYEIRWWWQDVFGVERTHLEAFEVVTALRARGPAYALVADLRAEGVPAQRIPDAELHQKIVRASKLFEQYTGRAFAPAYKTLRGDGRGAGVFYFGEPIIALEQVHHSGNRYFAEGDHGPSRRNLRIYNRHTTGMLDPDDRDNPRIEYGGGALEGRRFERGQQNVYARGVFGYTDFVEGGGPAGEVPELVQHAVRLLTFRDLPKLWDVAEREDAQKRWKLTSESTRDQSYGMLGGVDAATRGAVVGGTTGDPEIDNIIILYRRGGQIGAA